MKTDKKIVRNAFNQASETITDAISSDENVGLMRDIAKRNNLSATQIGEIGDETTLVMLGLTRPEDFVSSIETRASVSGDVARAIAQEINEKIFRPIREELKKVHGLPTVGAVTGRPEAVNATHEPIMNPERELGSGKAPVAPLTKTVLKTPTPFTPKPTYSSPFSMKPQMPRSEGIVPLEKKPASVAPMSDWQRREPVEEKSPFRTMKEDSFRASLNKQFPKTPSYNRVGDENSMDKESLLRSIETPSPTAPTSILSSKLSATTKIPRDEVHMEAVKPDTRPIRKEYGADPYREAV